MEADRDSKPGRDVEPEEEHHVAPVQSTVPDLPGGDPDCDKGDHRDEAGDDAVARLVCDRLNVCGKGNVGCHGRHG